MPKTKTKTSNYGTCWECHNSIEIPGADAFKCSVCGWRKAAQKTIYQGNNERRSKTKAKIRDENPSSLFNLK